MAMGPPLRSHCRRRGRDLGRDRCADVGATSRRRRSGTRAPNSSRTRTPRRGPDECRTTAADVRLVAAWKVEKNGVDGGRAERVMLCSGLCFFLPAFSRSSPRGRKNAKVVHGNEKDDLYCGGKQESACAHWERIGKLGTHTTIDTDTGPTRPTVYSSSSSSSLSCPSRLVMLIRRRVSSPSTTKLTVLPSPRNASATVTVWSLLA